MNELIVLDRYVGGVWYIPFLYIVSLPFDVCCWRLWESKLKYVGYYDDMDRWNQQILICRLDGNSCCSSSWLRNFNVGSITLMT